MLTRRFGRTELRMPVLSCGGMRFQHKWQDLPLADVPEAEHERLDSTARAALSHGILHIETARGYGSSERQLGRFLRGVDRDGIILQTKIAPREEPKQFVAEFGESLARLGVESVDLLSLHGINDRVTLGWALRPGGCFEQAQALREAGKTRFVGFSTHGATEIIREAITHGDPEVGRGFDYVNLHYYFIFQRNWQAIVDAAERDMGVFIISPTDKGGHLWAPPPKLVDLCAPMSPMVFNDLFCLSRPEVHTLSVGAARPSDFDEHLRALPLLDGAPERIAPVVARLRRAMREATGDADPECFDVGVPDHTEAPGGLNLRTILWLYNLARGWDLVGYGKARFNMMGNAGHWFPGAKARTLSEMSPERIIEAVAASPRADEVPRLLTEALGLLGGAEQRRLSES